MNSERTWLKHHTYMQIAKELTNLSTCNRLHVGCVLLDEQGRICGCGYNGAGPGMPHCNDEHCNSSSRCNRTVHAEQNALLFRVSASRPMVAYVTHEPCVNCTKELALAGVRTVYYDKPYTSIGDQERLDRLEWIGCYNMDWIQL